MDQSVCRRWRSHQPGRPDDRAPGRKTSKPCASPHSRCTGRSWWRDRGRTPTSAAGPRVGLFDLAIACETICVTAFTLRVSRSARSLIRRPASSMRAFDLPVRALGPRRNPLRRRDEASRTGQGSLPHLTSCGDSTAEACPTMRWAQAHISQLSAFSF